VDENFMADRVFRHARTLSADGNFYFSTASNFLSQIFHRSGQYLAFGCMRQFFGPGIAL